MMCEQIEGFTNGLIEKTKEKQLQWMPFSSYNNFKNLEKEFDSGFAGFDYGVNSIRVKNSYYLKNNDGYVFLFEIYHGDPDVTSPDFDSLALMVKINDILPVENLTSHMGDEEHQESLATLKLLIEHYLEEKYDQPDTLYNFMHEVLMGGNKVQNSEGTGSSD